MQIPNSDLTEGTISLKTPDFQPHFDQAEVTLTGNPTSIAAPFGIGLHLTEARDRIIYKFPVSKPWPCPFNIAECPTGITGSFWFRRNYVKAGTAKRYVRFGSVFTIYAPTNSKRSVITWRWNLEGRGGWYGFMAIPSGEWSLVAWVMNKTHNVRYLNGVGQKPQLKTPVNLTATIDNELHISDTNRFRSSNFSVGPIRIWAGRLSPVYMWRTFQEGLPDQNENWCSFRTLQWCHNERDGVSNHQPQDCLLSRLFRQKIKERNQSSASLAFGRGIHRISPHKRPVTQKMFPFDDVIMKWEDVPKHVM